MLFVPLSFVEAQHKDLNFSDDIFCIDTITIKNPICIEYKYKEKYNTGQKKRIFWKFFYYPKEEVEISYRIITSKDNLDSLCLKYNDKKDRILLDNNCYLLKYGGSVLSNFFFVNTSLDLMGILDVYRKSLTSAWKELTPVTSNQCNDKIFYSNDYPTDKFAIFLYKASYYNFFMENELSNGLYIKIAVPIIKDSNASNIRELSFKNKDLQIDTLDVVYLNKEDYKILHILNDGDNRDIIYLIRSDKIISLIEIPNKCYNNAFVKANKSGFEISVEYYISECYYNKVFNFKYQDSNYFLTSIYTNKYDNGNPKKIKQKKDKLKSKVSIDKFKIDDYL